MVACSRAFCQVKMPRHACRTGIRSPVESTGVSGIPVALRIVGQTPHRKLDQLRALANLPTAYEIHGVVITDKIETPRSREQGECCPRRDQSKEQSNPVDQKRGLGRRAQLDRRPMWSPRFSSY